MQDDNRLYIEGNKVLVTEPGMYAPVLINQAAEKVVDYSAQNPLGKKLYLPKRKKLTGRDIITVTTELGYTYGPGWQIILENHEPVLYADNLDVALADVKARLKKSAGRDYDIQ